MGSEASKPIAPTTAADAAAVAPPPQPTSRVPWHAGWGAPQSAPSYVADAMLEGPWAALTEHLASSSQPAPHRLPIDWEMVEAASLGAGLVSDDATDDGDDHSSNASDTDSAVGNEASNQTSSDSEIDVDASSDDAASSSDASDASTQPAALDVTQGFHVERRCAHGTAFTEVEIRGPVQPNGLLHAIRFVPSAQAATFRARQPRAAYIELAGWRGGHREGASLSLDGEGHVAHTAFRLGLPHGVATQVHLATGNVVSKVTYLAGERVGAEAAADAVVARPEWERPAHSKGRGTVRPRDTDSGSEVDGDGDGKTDAVKDRATMRGPRPEAHGVPVARAPQRGGCVIA